MCLQIARKKRVIFTLVALVSLPITIKVIFAMIKFHHFLSCDASSLTDPVQLTQKRENLIKEHFKTFNLDLAHPCSSVQYQIRHDMICRAMEDSPHYGAKTN